MLATRKDEGLIFYWGLILQYQQEIEEITDLSMSKKQNVKPRFVLKT